MPSENLFPAFRVLFTTKRKAFLTGEKKKQTNKIDGEHNRSVYAIARRNKMTRKFIILLLLSSAGWRFSTTRAMGLWPARNQWSIALGPFAKSAISNHRSCVASNSERYKNEQRIGDSRQVWRRRPAGRPTGESSSRAYSPSAWSSSCRRYR